MDKASYILKRVRRIELRARHLATENFAGQYQSGFRGQGLDFDDFREYMPGDDPRFIDWKVTARMNSPFVRRFREEREQAVILAVDVSGSMHYASSAARVSKLDYAAEVAAVLAYSAAQSGDKCGLLIYGNSHSHYIPPAKGVKQTLRIVREIVASKNDGADQNISDVARQLVLSQKKAAMVIMISDFWGENNKAALGQLNMFWNSFLFPMRRRPCKPPPLVSPCVFFPTACFFLVLAPRLRGPSSVSGAHRDEPVRRALFLPHVGRVAFGTWRTFPQSSAVGTPFQT